MYNIYKSILSASLKIIDLMLHRYCNRIPSCHNKLVYFYVWNLGVFY